MKTENTFTISTVDEDGYTNGEGEFRVLADTKTFDKYGESYDRILTVKAPAGWTDFQVGSAMQMAFHYSCSCSHDCCGHGQSYVQFTKHTKRREYLVGVRGYYNV